MSREKQTLHLQKGDTIYKGPANDAEPYLVTAALIAEIVKDMPGASMIIIDSLKHEIFNESGFPLDDEVFFVHKPH